MKPQSAKNKGRKLQQFVAAVIKNIFNLGEGDAESRPMGSAGVDIMSSPKAREKFPFSIECKNTRSFPSLKALNQSYVNEMPATLGCVVWKPPGKPMSESIIYFNFEDFATFWKKEKGEVDAKIEDE